MTTLTGFMPVGCSLVAMQKVEKSVSLTYGLGSFVYGMSSRTSVSTPPLFGTLCPPPPLAPLVPPPPPRAGRWPLLWLGPAAVPGCCALVASRRHAFFDLQFRHQALRLPRSRVLQALVGAAAGAGSREPGSVIGWLACRVATAAGLGCGLASTASGGCACVVCPCACCSLSFRSW